MLNTKIVGLLFVLSLSLLGLVQVKVYVQDLRENIVEMEQVKSKLGDEVQVLKAEWSNLNRPERLKKLSGKYLKMKDISVDRIVYMGGSFNNKDLQIIPIKNRDEYQAASWRYKTREMIMKSSKDR